MYDVGTIGLSEKLIEEVTKLLVTRFEVKVHKFEDVKEYKDLIDFSHNCNLNDSNCSIILLSSLTHNHSLKDVISTLRNKCAHSEILLITFNPNYQQAISAFRAGVRDILEYPFEREDVIASFDAAIKYGELTIKSTQLSEAYGLINLLGDSRKFDSLEEFFENIQIYIRTKFASDGLKIFTIDAGEDGYSNEAFIEEGINLFWEGVESNRSDEGHVYHALAKWHNKNKATELGAILGVELIENKSHVIINLGQDDSQYFIAHFDTENKVKGLAIFEQFANVTISIFQQLIHFQIEKDLKHLAHIDDVTGLFNQRRLYIDLELFIKEYKLNQSIFSILFIDIDYFKQVNDKYGHLIGSIILVEVAKEFKKVVRETDLMYRYGGDEFVILLPGIKKEAANHVANRVLEIISKKRFNKKLDQMLEQELSLSVSIGLATFPDDAKSKVEILKFADDMMYTAKSKGRGQVCHAGSLAKEEKE
ncbi:GGDEF domain-containing protein [Bacteriovoracaceae bacterium]|nr:GGDEF domain-containing protein [Bacteriovoracaceae bacterium]